MGANIAPAAAPGVAVEQGVAKPVQGLRRPQLFKRGSSGRTRRGRAQERVDVRRGPLAGKEALGESEVAADQQAQHALPAMYLDICLFSAASARDHDGASAG
jgi:hypothetical protein